MRRLIAGLLALAVCFSVAACSSSSNGNKKPDQPPAPSQPNPPKKEQVIRINIGSDPKELDPITSTGMPEANVELSLFEGLMRLDADGRPVPGLAASYEVKDNGLTYIFRLRDAKWSNGEPITAEDFVWSWKRALDPFIASQYAVQLYYIKGGEKLNSIPLNQMKDGKEVKGADGKPIPRPEAEVKAEIQKAAEALGVKAIDPKTLEVKLEAPTPYFLSLAAFHTLCPIHRKSVEANPQDWYRKPESMVVSGPFKLASWTPKDKIVLVKNPNYYDADKVKLDKIEYYLIDQITTATTMFESGQLDMIESGVNDQEIDRLRKERANELKILPDLAFYFYRFNVTKAPFDNPKVRRALSLAIDRKGICENILRAGQIPAMGIVPSGIPDVSGDFRKNGGDHFKDNDIAEAKKLLAEAGFPDGKGFPKVGIKLNNHETHRRIAEAIQQMWKKNLGIDVTVSNEEWQVYLDDMTNMNFQILRSGWTGDYVDPMTFIDLFVKDGGNNNTGWSNPKFDELVAKAKATGDQKVRMQAMHDAEKLLMDEMPIAPIYYYVRLRLVHPKIKGWSEPLTSGMNLREAYWE